MTVPISATSGKKVSTPNAKKVTTRSLVSPSSPSPFCASAGPASTSSIPSAQSNELARRVRIAPKGIARGALKIASVPSQKHQSGPAGAEPRVPEDPLTCLIEIPKGSRNKYEWDHEPHAIKLDRLLFSSVVYPTDYGFIPDTLSLDGDPLDVMVCVAEPTFPGCLIAVKPVALLRMEDDQGKDDKVLCVPLEDPSWSWLEDLEDLPKNLQDEITHFFSIYKNLEQKGVSLDGWYGRAEAIEEIEASRARRRERGESAG